MKGATILPPWPTQGHLLILPAGATGLHEFATQHGIPWVKATHLVDPCGGTAEDVRARLNARLREVGLV